MAGKRGMKHLRGKTQAEKDEYALLKMEQFIDTQVLYCEECKEKMGLNSLSGPIATLLSKRYDKLRSNAPTELKVSTASYIKDLAAIEHGAIPAELPDATQQSTH